jgi:hypothetical protein
LPNLKIDDAADTFKHTIESAEDDRSGDRELVLKKFI